MIDLGKKSPIQILAAGLLGFVGIVGLGSLAIMHHGGASPAKAPMSVYSAVDADSGAPAPLRSARPAPGPAVAASGMSSPLPVLPAEATRDASAAAAAAPGVSAGSAAAPAASATTPKLAARAVSDMSGSASSSASASVNAVAAAPKLKPAPARKPFLPPKLDLPKNVGSVASSVHYGVSGRSELMGRAAGPVYNFSGGAAKDGGQVAADNATASGAMRQVDAAERQFEASDASDEDKAKLRRQLDQVRATAASADSAAP